MALEQAVADNSAGGIQKQRGTGRAAAGAGSGGAVVLSSSGPKDAEYSDQGLAAKVLASGIATDAVLRNTISFPIQLWRFGPSCAASAAPQSELEWVGLGGEPTIEYAMRIRESLDRQQISTAPSSSSALQPEAAAGRRVWTSGYCNDVMSYVPSERVLGEGGYEGGENMIWYGHPSRYAEGIEGRIIAGAEGLARQLDQEADAGAGVTQRAQPTALRGIGARGRSGSEVE